MSYTCQPEERWDPRFRLGSFSASGSFQVDDSADSTPYVPSLASPDRQAITRFRFDNFPAAIIFSLTVKGGNEGYQHRFRSVDALVPNRANDRAMTRRLQANRLSGDLISERAPERLLLLQSGLTECWTIPNRRDTRLCP